MKRLAGPALTLGVLVAIAVSVEAGPSRAAHSPRTTSAVLVVTQSGPDVETAPYVPAPAAPALVSPPQRNAAPASPPATAEAPSVRLPATPTPVPVDPNDCPGGAVKTGGGLGPWSCVGGPDQLG
jgi:hypothetical protein